MVSPKPAPPPSHPACCVFGGVFHLLGLTPLLVTLLSSSYSSDSKGATGTSAFPGSWKGVCRLVIKIRGRVGDGAARFCSDVACWLTASDEAALLKSPWFGKRVPRLQGRGGWFYSRLAGRRTEWIWQKFWKGVCAVLEREGDLLVKGGFPEDALFAGSRVLKLGSLKQSLVLSLKL